MSNKERTNISLEDLDNAVASAMKKNIESNNVVASQAVGSSEAAPMSTEEWLTDLRKRDIQPTIIQAAAPASREKSHLGSVAAAAIVGAGITAGVMYFLYQDICDAADKISQDASEAEADNPLPQSTGGEIDHSWEPVDPDEPTRNSTNMLRMPGDPNSICFEADFSRTCLKSLGEVSLIDYGIDESGTANSIELAVYDDGNRIQDTSLVLERQDYAMNSESYRSSFNSALCAITSGQNTRVLYFLDDDINNPVMAGQLGACDG